MFVRRLKLRPPAVLPTWLSHLRAATFGPGVRVIAVVAGPGYGKTVYASQLANAWPGPVFWYACDAGDADLAVFAAHLSAMTKEAGRTAGAPPATPQEVGANAAEVLATTPQALVVFDDVHALQGHSLAALGDLIDRASAIGITFVLCGREMPLALHGFAARGSLASVAASALAFDEATSRRFLSDACGGRLAPERIEEFVRLVEGWPAGLSLAASMPAANQRTSAPGGVASLEMLFAYLAAEVLDDLDEDERRFLLETAILEDLEVDACDAVVRSRDARERLGRLARRGLFVARSSEAAFEAHGLFSVFLRDRLAREYSSEARAVLHDRAAAFFVERGDHLRAIEHHLRAGRRDVAAKSLARMALPLLASGRAAQVERLLTEIGAERVADEPVLAIARGRLQQAAGAWDAALATLARADVLARERGEDDVAAEAVRAMAPMLGARGEHERLGLLLDGALALALSDAKRATVSVTLGAHLLDRGRYDDVLALYAEIGPAVAALDDLAQSGVVLHNTGVAHVRRGDPFAALGFYERALAVKRESGQRVSALVTLGNLCGVLRALGDLSAARRVADECTREARIVGNTAMLAHALESAGHVALAADDLDAAAAMFSDACAVSDPSDTSFLPDALMGSATVALRRGDTARAAAECARAAALLRAQGDEQRSAALLALRARVAHAAGDPATAFAFTAEAHELAQRGADALATTTIELEVAVVAAVLGTAPARALAVTAARGALARMARRDYQFLERTHGEALAAARAIVAAGAGPGEATLVLELLGGMRVVVAGNALDAGVWKRRKAREIFAYLVCERGRLVPRARLLDTFWPDADADSASDTLRVAISAIRRAAGDVVRYENGGYRFGPAVGATLDLDAFDAALQLARGARETRDAAAARASYALALELYHGDLLDGLDDATWHLRERARLRDGALEAARALVADPETAEELRAQAIHRYLELAPFDVDAMRAWLDRLIATRRVGEARDEYARWQERYREAFGDAAPEFWQVPQLAIVPRAS